MPVTEVCPSCGGKQLAVLEHNGRKYKQCVTPREKRFGTGKRMRVVTAPCGFWTTKESAWQPSKSS